MKFRFLIWCVVNLAFLCYACSNDKVGDETPEKPTIKIDPNENTSPVFTSDGGNSTFHFTATSDWSASVMNTRADTWISVQPVSGGAGEITININFASNDSYDERNATIQIKCGEVVQNIVVSQKQKNALMLTTSRIEVPQSGGTIQAEVKANVQYRTEIPELYQDWITPASRSRTLETSSLNFKIEASKNILQREGQIIIHEEGGTLSDTLHIYQFGGPIVVISRKEYIIPSQGETIAVEIESNTDYEVLPVTEAWISLSDERSVSTHTNYYVIAPNDTYDSRDARIIYRAKNSHVADTVKIHQVQKGVLALNPSQYNISGNGGVFTVEVKSNEQYVVEIPSSVDWIHQRKTKAVTTSDITFTVDSNVTVDMRKALITFKSETQTGTLAVNQDGRFELNVSEDTIRVSAAAITKEFVLTANTNWTLQSNNENWCTVSPIQGSQGSHTIKVNITENTSMLDSRVALLTATIDTIICRITVLQDRKEPDPNINKGIRTLDDLINFRDAVNQGKDISMWKYNGEINLLADIDLSYVDNWEPIGYWNSKKVCVPFDGIFNGNGYTLRNLKITSNASTVGLFGYSSGIIKNVKLENVEIKGTKNSSTNNYIGGICGWNFVADGNANGKIINCSIEGCLSGNGAQVGGICGYNQGAINDCVNNAGIFGEKIGGICGYNYGNVASCVNNGFVFRDGDSFLIGSGNTPTDCSDNVERKIDSEFYKFLKSKGIASLSDLMNTTTLSLTSSAYKPASLSGIEYFTNLEKLVIKKGSISELDLSHNKKLTYLDLNFNGTQLNLSENKELNYLKLNAQKLEVIDFSPLTELNYINLYGIQCSEIDLSNHLKLTQVYIGSTTKSNLSTLNLNGCSILEQLDCSSTNTLTNLNIEGCKALKTIKCNLNKLTSLNLNGCKELETLDCASNQIEEIDFGGCSNLKMVSCADNKLRSINITDCKLLENLQCSKNLIEGVVDLSGCGSLVELFCAYNQITDLKLNGCTGLTQLYCIGNKISVLNVEDCIALNSLYCPDQTLTALYLGNGGDIYCALGPNCRINGGNNIILEVLLSEDWGKLDYSNLPIVDFTLTGDVNIDELNLSNTLIKDFYVPRVTKVDFSGCDRLTELRCSNGVTKELNVSGCSSLVSLDCSESPIVSLNVSDNMALKELKCGACQLQSLDLSNTQVSYLACGYNPLTDLILPSELTGKIVLYPSQNQPLKIKAKSEVYLMFVDAELADLDISECPNVIGVECKGLGLKTLTLGDKPKMNSLDCSANQLSDLNLSLCPELISLSCTGNKLTALDLSKNKKLNAVDCHDNLLLTKLLLEAEQAIENLSKDEQTQLEYK